MVHQRRAYLIIVALVALVVASPVGASDLYPAWGTGGWSLAGIASMAQRLIASGTSVPAAASGSAGDLYILTGARPSILRHDGTSWVGVGGDSGALTVVVGATPSADLYEPGDAIALLATTTAGAGGSLKVCLADYVASSTEVGTLTPQMVSNTAPTGRALWSADPDPASIVEVASYPPYKAFDRITATSTYAYCCDQSASGSTAIWLEYQFDEPVQVATITFSSQNWDFATWDFQGSNDGLSWTSLASGSDAVVGTTLFTIVASITTPALYTRYRVGQVDLAASDMVWNLRIYELTMSGYRGVDSGHYWANVAGSDALASEDVELPYEWGVSSFTLQIRGGLITGVTTP